MVKSSRRSFYPRDAMLARVLAMTLCLSVSLFVCLSVTNRCSIEMVGEIELAFLACRLLSTYPTRCSEEIQVCAKIRALPSGTLSQTPDLENFVSAYRSSRSVIN